MATPGAVVYALDPANQRLYRDEVATLEKNIRALFQGLRTNGRKKSDGPHATIDYRKVPPKPRLPSAAETRKLLTDKVATLKKVTGRIATIEGEMIKLTVEPCDELDGGLKHWEANHTDVPNSMTKVEYSCACICSKHLTAVFAICLPFSLGSRSTAKRNWTLLRTSNVHWRI